MATQIKRSYEPFFKEPRQFGPRFPNGFPHGKQTERRAKENRELNKLPDSVKKVCEINLPGICLRHHYLSWAHSRKARFLVTSKDWQEAARACLPCHDAIEAMSHSEMARIVKEAIKRRKS